MARYIFKKLLYGILVLWGVVSLVFFIFSINPGDPARMLLGQRVDDAALAKVKREMGLDLPLHKQYFFYLNDVSPISVHSALPASHIYINPNKYKYVSLFGIRRYELVAKRPYLRRSYQSRKQVADIIAEAMPGTIILAMSAISFALLFGISLGVVSALYKDHFVDRVSLFGAVLGMSAPSFFSAIIISWIGGYLWADVTNLPAIPVVFLIIGIAVGVWRHHGRRFMGAITYGLKGLLIGIGLLIFNWILGLIAGVSIVPCASCFLNLPGTGLPMTGSLYGVDVFEGEYLALENLILPAITLGIRPLAIIVQLTRNSMLEVLSQDFIRTARAKGIPERRVVVRHALRNALNPVLTAVSGWFASMLAGAVFIEFIFNWKGLGLQVFQSLQNDDFPVVMGSVLVIAATFVVINIAVDIMYAVLDPRIRLTS